MTEYDPMQKCNTVYEIGEYLGVAALRKQGGLLLATRSGFHFFDRETGEKSLILNPKENTENFRFNDGKCDPQGRFWAGTLTYDLEEGGGNLYCLRSDLQAEIMLKRSEAHTSELQSRGQLVCRLLLEKKKNIYIIT